MIWIIDGPEQLIKRYYLDSCWQLFWNLICWFFLEIGRFLKTPVQVRLKLGAILKKAKNTGKINEILSPPLKK
jgi:hypothetical protein